MVDWLVQNDNDDDEDPVKNVCAHTCYYDDKIVYTKPQWGIWKCLKTHMFAIPEY